MADDAIPIGQLTKSAYKSGTTIAVKVEETPVQSGVFRLSLWEWMTIAHKQKFRCACGCGSFLGARAIVVRNEMRPTMPVNALDAFQCFEFGCKSNLLPSAELSSYADRARLVRAASQSYKCHGYGDIPCLLELIPEVFHVDHQNPTRWGGADDEENKHILCPTCHAKKSSHEITLSTCGSLVRPPPPSSRAASSSLPCVAVKSESPSTASSPQAEQTALDASQIDRKASAPDTKVVTEAGETIVEAGSDLESDAETATVAKDVDAKAARRRNRRKRKRTHFSSGNTKRAAVQIEKRLGEVIDDVKLGLRATSNQLHPVVGAHVRYWALGEPLGIYVENKELLKVLPKGNCKEQRAHLYKEVLTKLQVAEQNMSEACEMLAGNLRNPTPEDEVEIESSDSNKETVPELKTSAEISQIVPTMAFNIVTHP